MPEAFEKCRKAGGKIRTKDLGNGKYMHVCILNGKSYAGYVKMKDSKGSKYTKELMHASKR